MAHPEIRVRASLRSNPRTFLEPSRRFVSGQSRPGCLLLDCMSKPVVGSHSPWHTREGVGKAIFENAPQKSSPLHSHVLPKAWGQSRFGVGLFERFEDPIERASHLTVVSNVHRKPCVLVIARDDVAI